MNALSTITSASDIQMDYMKLLVTQLQNQNPLEPLDNQEMASQLAQFNQLNQLENMNINFAKVLDSIERSYASSLIGRDVSYLIETEEGTKESQSNKVEQVYYDIDNEILLVVGSDIIRLGDILSVKG